MGKALLSLIVILILAAAAYWVLTSLPGMLKTDNNGGNQAVTVTNFKECAAAGYPVQESSPSKCTAPDGQVFTEEVQEAKKDDLIAVVSPKPNQAITSPLTITGRARGNWYFEASFPVILKDANGKVLAQAPAQAQGDWMTTEYVPFVAKLTFAKPTTATGTLILEKDNPSGLPQNADQLEIPVKFE